MKQYLVTMPFAGAVTVTVEAQSEEDAISAFWLKMEEVDIADTNVLLKENVELTDFDYLPVMIEGNVRHFNHNKVDVALMHDDEQ